MENLIVKLETRHFKEARAYSIRFSCPLYVVLKELYPALTGLDDIIVNIESVSIDDKRYTIDGGAIENGKTQAYSGLSERDVDSLINKAKLGIEIETVTVTLIPVE